MQLCACDPCRCMDRRHMRPTRMTLSHTWWPYYNTKARSIGLHRISLILDIHVTVNWHLLKQGVRWPVLPTNLLGIFHHNVASTQSHNQSEDIVLQFNFDFQSSLVWRLATERKHAQHRSKDRPFYGCLLGDLAFEWQRGWRRPWYTDLTAFSCKHDKLRVNMTKAARSVSKQGHF